MKNIKNILLKTTILISTLFGVMGCSSESSQSVQNPQINQSIEVESDNNTDKVRENDTKGIHKDEKSQRDKYPAINTDGVVIINDNIPFFDNKDLTNLEVYHKIGNFDELGRTTAANAVVGTELMPPSGSRESISHIYPTGWKQAKYANVDSGGWLYNRSHLIGHQMTGNNDPENLITGTRWFNVAMIEYENYLADYVERTDKVVRYRVTPVYEGDNLVASGIYMEAYSLEDAGEGVMFNIYVANVQPGVEINYSDGSSVGPEGPVEYENSDGILPHDSTKNNKGKDIKEGDLEAVDTDGNGRVTIKEAKEAGFEMPIKRGHWLYEYMHDANNDGQVGE